MTNPFLKKVTVARSQTKNVVFIFAPVTKLYEITNDLLKSNELGYPSSGDLVHGVLYCGKHDIVVACEHLLAGTLHSVPVATTFDQSRDTPPDSTRNTSIHTRKVSHKSGHLGCLGPPP